MRVWRTHFSEIRHGFTHFSEIGTPDVFPDYSGYAASASPSRACRIVVHPSAFLSVPLRYHSM